MNKVAFSEILEVPLRNGLTRPKAVRGTGIKMVNMGELFAYSRLQNVSMDRVPFSMEKEQDYLLKDGDLLFARQSLVLSGAGKCSVFIRDTENVTFEGHIIRARVNNKLADPIFYYYFFNSPLGRSTIEGIVEQVAAAGIRGSDLAKLHVPYPPLSEQRAIAHILGTLDDKIELNRRMNETLEAIGQALLTEWFTSSTEGQEWKLGDLVDSVSITHKFNEEKIIFLNTSDIDAGRVLRHEHSSVIGLPGQAKKSIRKLDILFSEIRPANKRYALIDFDAQDYVVSTKLMVLRTKSHVHPIVIYNYLTSAEILNHLQRMAETRSGTFPQITFDQIRELTISLPAKVMLEKYTSLAWSFFQKIKSNERESNTLAALRDTLLPKLISGEILIKDVEMEITKRHDAN